MCVTLVTQYNYFFDFDVFVSKRNFFLREIILMLRDMPLTKEEHYQVVNRLGQHMEKLTCQEVPAFVYQLLKLCHSQNSRSIFLRLQNYFGTRIYSKLNVNQFSDSESTNLDTIGETFKIQIAYKFTFKHFR